MTIKTYHEAPLAIFDKVQTVTSGDYALVHLFEENQEYYDKFYKAIHWQKREVILDNSIFELGTAFDADAFAEWVIKLEPTWYIIPDSLENMEQTVTNAYKWMADYRDLPGKKIGVVQGKNTREILECYNEIEPLVDCVAISFDYSFFELDYYPELNKLGAWCFGRRRLLERLGMIANRKKPHHLLGCSLPQEFYGYQNHYPWVTSVDTSNPVVHGLKGIYYEKYGLSNKESVKLYTLINSEVSQDQENAILYNINEFRRILNSPFRLFD